MADTYVDLTNGSDASDGLTWANAKVTMQAGNTAAGSGGRCFVQIDTNDVATTKDTAAGARSLTFLGTEQVPFGLYGVKNGTTAEPPTDSDLVVRGTDTLPVFEAGTSITIDEATSNSGVTIVINGIDFAATATNTFNFGQDISCFLYDCITRTGSNYSLAAGCSLKLTNCEIASQHANFKIYATQDAFEMIGGLLSGTSPTILVPVTTGALFNFYGVDLSAVTTSLVDLGSAGDTGYARFVNCKLATGVSRLTASQPKTEYSFIEVIGSSDETGLGSGESVRSYAKEWFKGTVLDESTIIRTGGVSDGIAGWSYVVQPRSASTKEGLLSIPTPWFTGIVEGDAATSKDFTVYIANDSGADLTKADVWLELLYPSTTGITQHELDLSSRTAIDASAASVADDTASDWSTGAGGKNAQKIIVSATPDYQGPVYGRVHFAQAGTTKLYVDPKVYVTDT